jgi:tetratricopeptide (TPR) repeat protein
MKMFLAVLILLLTACAAAPAKQTIAAEEPRLSADDQLIHKGAELVAAGSIKQALDDYFDPVAERCEALQKASKGKIFSSRSSVESLYYMVSSAANNMDAEAQSPTCGQAFYYKGYASLDLGQPEDAMRFIQKSIEWSPVNSRYLSELGHLHQLNKDWKKSLETFQQSEEYAETFSPDNAKKDELARAKRGVGFNLIELGRLDEAEAKFKECLALNKADKTALNELEYIKALRKKAATK